jgi:5-methylcytosine-specific restriction endonuclease McrA|tara:strand:- start:134 stop:427 length:294 start_codon:yes stop_codon:yes gene_type:complete
MGRNFNDPVYKQWRKDVLTRDCYKCQMPNCKRKGKRMQVHHIQKWSSASYLRYDVDNGITLCWDCHNYEVNQYEEAYVGLFMDIVAENKKQQEKRRR